MINLVSERVYEQLVIDLSGGGIHQDGRVLPEKELSQRYNVAVGTVRKAVGRLIKEGVLERQQGRGTFLVAPVGGMPDSGFCGEDVRIPLHWGNAFVSFFQDRIMSLLFEGERDHVTVETLPYASDIPPLGTAINHCDAVFFSPLQALSGKADETLSPVPFRLFELLSDYYPQGVLDAFVAPGSMRLMGIPMIANPTVSYLHSDTFRQAGIELPVATWSWNDCLETARELKRDNPARVPLALHPSLGNLYEPVLWHFGGDYFSPEGEPWLPEQSLAAMVDLFRCMYEEGLAINLYKVSLSYPEFVARTNVAIIFCGPILGGALPQERRQEWMFHPMPGSEIGCGTSSTVFGVGVPSSTKKPDKLWDELWQVLHARGGMERMAEVSGIFPASFNGMKKWKGGGVRCPEVMTAAAMHARPVQAGTGFIDWYIEVYRIFDEMISGVLTVSQGRDRILSILRRSRERSFSGLLV